MQLARFAAVALKPPRVASPIDVDVLASLLDSDPELRERVRGLHREFQDRIDHAAHAADQED